MKARTLNPVRPGDRGITALPGSHGYTSKSITVSAKNTLHPNLHREFCTQIDAVAAAARELRRGQQRSGRPSAAGKG